MELDPKTLVFRYWFVIVLLVIVLTSFWFRAMPARFNELQALDPFVFYRTSEYVLNNNWQMPEMDMLRYFPDGVSPFKYVTIFPVYMPALTYAALSTIGMDMPYLNFAILFPALMGALAVFITYFVGKELFNSRKAGLFAAFFLGVTPAFLTRTSAGFFEKEPIAGVFMMLTVLFFIKAFKVKSWKRGLIHGSISGLSLGLMTITWGGAQYMYLLMSGFFVILFSINLLLVILDYLFPGNFNTSLEQLDKFLGPKMLKAYLPLLSFAILFQNVIPLPRSSLGTLDITSPLIMLSFAVLGVLALRFAVKKYGFIKNENVKYFVPGMMIFGFLVLLIGSMFSEFFSNIIYQLSAYANPVQVTGSLGSTIAENMPGTLGEVTGKLSNSFAGNVPLGFLSQYFTLWILMILGCCIAGYKFFKTKNYLYLFIIFWVVSSIWSVFAKIRLTFLVGPAAAIAGGLFLAWVVEKASKYRNVGFMITRKIGMVTIIAGLIVFLAVFFNLANGYIYSNMLGPSICFPMQDEQGNAVPCLDIEDDSTYKMAENQPWYQAMDFLSQTGQDNSVLSWWDFGYWFQARGNKPSVVDGGNLGEYARRNDEIAQWFISPTDTWSEQVSLLEKFKVGYILMDYTLIGKFGAISSIATKGQNIMGFMEFKQSNTYQRDGQTVFEFRSGPYAIWVPVNENGNAVGSLKFMQLDGDRYFQIGYINDVCTTNGILHVGDEEQSIGGCVVMSPLGVFMVQPDAKDSIFTNLMFMDGYGLPLEKVFDNTFVKIYKVLY